MFVNNLRSNFGSLPSSPKAKPVEVKEITKGSPEADGFICDGCPIGEGSFSTYYTFTKGTTTYAGTILKYENRYTEDGVLHTADAIYTQGLRIRDVYNEVNDGRRIVNLRASFIFRETRKECFSTPCIALIFDYCELGDLERYLREKDPLTDRDIKQILLDVSTGLEFIDRKGFIHHDVKTANILLTRDDKEQIRAKVGDLGLAARKGEFEGMGTPSFFPPEYWESYPYVYPIYDRSSLDHADVWALGNVMCEIMGKDTFVSDEELNTIEETHKHHIELSPRMEALKCIILNKEYPVYVEEEPLTIDKISRMIFQKERSNRPNIAQVREMLEQV